MNQRLKAVLPFIAAVAFPALLHAAPDGERDEMLTTLKSDIAARPSRVLVAVEDALTMDEQGACEIVKTSITLTKADSKLVGQIVYTALKHSPGMSAVIVECAVDTAPAAAAEIKKAMQRALGDAPSGDETDLTEGSGKGTTKDEPSGKEASGKEVSGKGVSGKEPTGKGGAAPEPEPLEDFYDFHRFGTGIGGIYLTPPHSGLSRGSFVPPVTPETPEPDPTPDPSPTP